MKRVFLLLIFLLALLLVGLASGQNAVVFEEMTQIGKARPRGMIYDPNFDRLVWVDALNRLQLVDASDFSVQHTLYDSGFYNAYEFSHNGRYLALAIDLRIEIWDTESGEIVTQFEPDGSLRAEEPLYWSPDDSVLAINTQVRAPQAIRRSENDTTNLPWVWDVASALGERRSILPNARAIPFFDYRNGFVFGANQKAVVGLPERLQILDIAPTGVEVIGEIPANRFEPDPIYVWKSLRDDMMYIRPDEGSSLLVQLDTETGNLVELLIGRDMNIYSLDDIQDIQLSQFTHIVGNPLDTQENSMMRFWFGDNYRAQFGYHPITITLLDFLDPATAVAGDGLAGLFYVFDETRGIGRFELIPFYDATGIDIAPDGNSMVVRRDSGTQRIEIYDLHSGILLNSFLTAMPEVAREGVLSFDGSGATVLSDFQRFSADSGEVVYEDLQYNSGFEQFFWNDDSGTLITVSGSRWWEWDITSGEVIRRETMRLGNFPLEISPDGERYLIPVSQDGNTLTDVNGNPISDTYEVVEIGMESRPRVIFDDLEGVLIEQVIPSPNWENYLVIYSVNNYNQHSPGNQIMIYNIDEGAWWHLAGDDLPYMDARFYGWLDNDTVYIYSEEGSAAPERIYGVDYHASGIPQCLVDAFPNSYQVWIPAWERFNYYMRSDRLNQLSLDVCALVPAEAETVNNFLFPTVTPTRLPVTATPSTIAGVPICLTNRFPNESREYAEIWHQLSEGLNAEELEELELLLCENLTGQSSSEFEPPLVTSNVEVMTINIHSGIREVGAYIPTREHELPANFELIGDAFRRQYGFYPDGKLSPNENLFAVRTQRNQVAIYRFVTPYRALADDATSTAEFIAEQERPTEEKVLSLKPTATQSFTYVGEARPTLTPTAMPTSPPLPEVVYSAQSDEVEEICPYTERFTVDNPPPDFAAYGRIITVPFQAPIPEGEPTPIPQGRLQTGILYPENGAFVFDDSLPECLGINCQISFDQNWIFYTSSSQEAILSRPDGSEEQILFYDNQLPYNTARDFRFIGRSTLQYIFSDYVEGQRNERSLFQRLDPETGTFFAPFEQRSPASYNNLPTSVVSVQPGTVNRYELMRTSFNTGSGEGYRYYIYDNQDGGFTYFAQTVDFQELTAFWHPLGKAFYYTYPTDPNWYVFIPDTEEFMLLGNLPNGIWSRDGRYRVDWVSLPPDEVQDRIEQGIPIQHFGIWDSTTGKTRTYCVPQVDIWLGNSMSNFYWSPDNRYLAFQFVLPEDIDYPSAPVRTFVLDTVTGSVTEVSDFAGQIVLWTQAEGGYR